MEILSSALAAGAEVFDLAGSWVISPSAEKEMHVARILLDYFNSTVSETQFSRDRLTRVLTPTKKHQIDLDLQSAYSVAEACENALRRYHVKDGILRLSHRIAWAFKDKKVKDYRAVLKRLQITLERHCKGMDRLEATHADTSVNNGRLGKKARAEGADHWAVTCP